MKMNKRIKKLWLMALRSGKYKQGRKTLKLGDNYCCLGVLCDLYIKETGTKWGSIPNSRRGIFMNMASELPPDVVDWAGLEGINPIVGKHYAIDRNDGVHIGKQSFNAIAKAIERHL